LQCKNKKDNECALDNQGICLDDFLNVFNIDGLDNNNNNNKDSSSSLRNNSNKKKKKEEQENCIVYDFGIRESPEYGLAFARQNCTTVGFDPSPISIKWWENNKNKIQKEYPTYTFLGLGAGGIDGDITLRECKTTNRTSFQNKNLKKFNFRTFYTNTLLFYFISHTNLSHDFHSNAS
jgi:hypothetical protein